MGRRWHTIHDRDRLSTRPRLFAACCRYLLLLGSAGPALAANELAPNIIVILIDDLGYADIGAFGASAYATPHLDRLAAEGRIFTDFVTSSAVCSASRAALLTGCYHRRVGISGALGPSTTRGLNPAETTLAELCRGRGYATACFGKWHLGHHPKFLPLQHGFDEYFGLPYSNDMWPLHPDHADLPADVARRKGGFPSLPLIEGNRVVDTEVTGEDQQNLTTWYTERAVDFIRRHPDQPFFLYLPHSMVHVPLFVSEKFRGKSTRGLFGDVAMEVDWSVGEILEVLDELGLAQRTLVVFSSDNGPWLSYGDHAGSAEPLREGKGTMFEGGYRVPTVMRWPGHIPAGTSCDELCSEIDILPTVAQLIRAPLPDRKIDGRNILPLMTAEAGAQSPHASFYCYYAGGQLQAIRDRRWKLHFPHEYRTLAGGQAGTDGQPVPYQKAAIGLELFDLKADPSEQFDVASDCPDVVQRLSQLAEQAREDLGDSLQQRKGDGVRPAGRLTDNDPRLEWIQYPELCVGEYQSEAEGAAQLDRFRATFQTADEWQQRAKRTRQQILSRTGLQPLPPRTPLHVITRRLRTYDGYHVESVTFESLPGFFVYGSLYRPSAERPGPYSGVLSVHGHKQDAHGGGRFRPDIQRRCATLARMGAVVLAVDMIGFGESRQFGWEHRSQQTLPLQLWSNIRALDLLCERNEVDEQRLGVTGASGGGTQSFLLAAVDERLDVSVPVCMVSAHFFGGCVCESGHPIHRTPTHETNNVDIAAAFAPRPQLLVSVGNDWTRNTPRVEFPYLQHVYRLLGAEAAVENAHFAEEDHDYGLFKRQAVYRFLARHLALDLIQIDEDRVTIESPEQIQVFDDDFPLPAHAIPPNQPGILSLSLNGEPQATAHRATADNVPSPAARR